MTNQNIQFTMKFDPADLQKLAQQISAIFGTRSVATNGGGPSASSPTPTQPTTQSILKPLLYLEFIKKSLDVITRNSSVANTYLGAMGKMFGAAMDLLLIPFMPIFNLLLVGLGKLVEWLSRDDVQKFLSKIAGFLERSLERFLGEAGKIAKTLEDVFNWIKDHGGGKIAEAGSKGAGWVDKQLNHFPSKAIEGLAGYLGVAGLLKIAPIPGTSAVSNLMMKPFQYAAQGLGRMMHPPLGPGVPSGGLGASMKGAGMDILGLTGAWELGHHLGNKLLPMNEHQKALDKRFNPSPLSGDFWTGGPIRHLLGDVFGGGKKAEAASAPNVNITITHQNSDSDLSKKIAQEVRNELGKIGRVSRLF